LQSSIFSSDFLRHFNKCLSANELSRYIIIVIWTIRARTFVRADSIVRNFNPLVLFVVSSPIWHCDHSVGVTALYLVNTFFRWWRFRERRSLDRTFLN
jgi:hypothetical protein